MQITVKLFAGLRSYLEEHTHGAARLTVPDGTTAGALLSGLGIPERMPRIIQINGEQREAGDPAETIPIQSILRHRAREVWGLRIDVVGIDEHPRTDIDASEL